MVDPRRVAVATVTVWMLLAGGLLAMESATGAVVGHTLAQIVGGISLGIALLGIVPLRMACRGAAAGESTSVMAGVMMSLSLRSSLTIFFLILAWKTGMAPRQLVGLWAIFWYASLLATEVVVVVRHFLATNRPDSLLGIPATKHITESPAR
ncbi:hypothetical protein FF011L_00650 [Roseimaritima multifibrata]|uniref:Uncharacterized protein n=2 Tax=Roseimaritima multifibrata TaxID=1930274 RepID=A0A517M8X1_9BACT|nr:hypothetical protein FF011L_00650 [Roseimaritima multifibrata]